MAEIILFGGTTEGRELAQALGEKGISTLVSVATEYGGELLPPFGSVKRRAGRLDETGMGELLRAEHPRLVLDATHPYAVEVSQTIRAACEGFGVPCVRVRRNALAGGDCVAFSSLADMVRWVDETPGVVFSTLGAKEAAALAGVKDAGERVWLRVLPLEESLRAVREAGFPARHIICMQGPFSRALNEAMFRAAGASVLLTKESGAAGGFLEKLQAARACGMTVALLTRPQEDGWTLEELKERIREGRL